MFKKQFSTIVAVALVSFSASVLAFNTDTCRVEDQEIIKDVKYNLSREKAAPFSDIKITSKDCLVTLSGNVKTSEAANRAIEVANSTAGVLDVHAENLIVNGSKKPFTDAYITAKVKGAFLREKVFGDDSISMTGIYVETKDGVVYLSGTATAVQVQNAVKLAKAIQGVKNVEVNVGKMAS